MKFTDDMNWGDPLSPRNFVERYRLPQLVRVNEDYLVEGDSSKSVSLNKPILLYKTYRTRKVYARSLIRNAMGEAVEVGPLLIMPDSYEGWFAVITKDGRTAGFFSTIRELAYAQVPYFLTKDEIHGFRLSRKSGSKAHKLKVQSGEILQLLGTCNHSSMNYAKVLNRRGDLILLSFAHTGKFYSVAGKRTRDFGHVYQIAQLLRFISKDIVMPIDVRIISGTIPPAVATSDDFSGLLRMKRVEEAGVILACARGRHSRRRILFEMNLDSSFLFLRPLSARPNFLTSRKCTKMLHFSREREVAWCKEIKIERLVYVESNHADDDDDDDSAVKCSLDSYASSSCSKPSSSSSNISKRLYEIWRKRRSAASASKKEDHTYERIVPAASRWSVSSLCTEILDDGYASSNFDSDY